MTQKKNKKLTDQPSDNSVSIASKIITTFGEKPLWQIIILVLLPFFIYIKTAGFEFINMDDVAIVQANYPILSSFKNIGLAFKTDAFISLHGDFYRPVQTISFMLDAFIGKDNPWIYHLTELIYHLLTVISLYYVLIALKNKKITAFLFSLIFSLHPVLTAAISWIPARGDILIGLLGTLMFLNFIKYIEQHRWYNLVLHILLFAIALFTKETAMLFPIVFLGYYFLLAKQKFNFKKLSPFFAAWVCGIIVFLIFRSKVVIVSPPDFILGVQPFIQNLPTIPITLAKFVLPLNLSTLPLFEPLFTLIGCGMLILSIVFAFNSFKKKQLLPIFGLIWFLLFTIPPMFFKIYYSKYLVEYYEHRSYLPIIGIIITTSFWFDHYLSRTNKTNFIWLPIIVTLLYTPLASVHCDHFKNSIEFFGRGADLGNPGAATKRGEMYLAIRDVANASSDFDKAIEFSNSEYPPAFYNRGIINLNITKDYKAAEADFTSTVTLDTSYFDAYINRANARVLLQNIPGALADLDKAQQFVPNNASVYHTRAKAYVTSQQLDIALQNLTKAISLDTTLAEAYNDRAFVYYRLKKLDEAAKDCDKAIALNPVFINAYYNKGMVLYERGLSDSAIKQFDITLSLANNFYFGYFYRGMAKLQKKDMKGACEDWKQSVDLGFTMAQDTIKKYCR